jgi:hypothetical protein
VAVKHGERVAECLFRAKIVAKKSVKNTGEFKEEKKEEKEGEENNLSYVNPDILNSENKKAREISPGFVVGVLSGLRGVRYTLKQIVVTSAVYVSLAFVYVVSTWGGVSVTHSIYFAFLLLFVTFPKTRKVNSLSNSPFNFLSSRFSVKFSV